MRTSIPASRQAADFTLKPLGCTERQFAELSFAWTYTTYPAFLSFHRGIPCQARDRAANAEITSAVRGLADTHGRERLRLLHRGFATDGLSAKHKRIPPPQTGHSSKINLGDSFEDRENGTLRTPSRELRLNSSFVEALVRRCLWNVGQTIKFS
jgi:hypothetical protein